MLRVALVLRSTEVHPVFFWFVHTLFSKSLGLLWEIMSFHFISVIIPHSSFHYLLKTAASFLLMALPHTTMSHTFILVLSLVCCLSSWFVHFLCSVFHTTNHLFLTHSSFLLASLLLSANFFLSMSVPLQSLTSPLLSFMATFHKPLHTHLNCWQSATTGNHWFVHSHIKVLVVPAWVFRNFAALGFGVFGIVLRSLFAL